MFTLNRSLFITSITMAFLGLQCRADDLSSYDDPTVKKGLTQHCVNIKASPFGSGILSEEDIKATLADTTLLLEQLQERLPSELKFPPDSLQFQKDCIRHFNELPCSLLLGLQVYNNIDDLRLRIAFSMGFRNDPTGFDDVVSRIKVMQERLRDHLFTVGLADDTLLSRLQYPGGPQAFYRDLKSPTDNKGKTERP